MAPLTCHVCRYPFERADGYATISWGRGETELEQLRSWSGHRVVCGECATVLRAWLGEPARPEPLREDSPTRPFSCHDESRYDAPS